ncbi:MAG: hypothetical protein ACXV5D_04465 [Halobacteriota archaeon]
MKSWKPSYWPLSPYLPPTAAIRRRNGDGHQARLYAEGTSLNVKGNELMVSDGQDLLFNTNTLNAWFNAKLQGNETVAKLCESRFLPEYKVAFDAWAKLDPLNNSHAPAGPRYMPDYHSSKMDQANNLTAAVASRLNEGTQTRAIGESYVRTTVFLATVLVLLAISQRFTIKSIRTGLTIVSFALLAFGVASLFTLPRIF